MDERPASTRLFLALWPGHDVRDLLRDWRDAWVWPTGAAPVATDKLHLTLHFLGNQPGERMPDLLAGLAVPFAPFRVDLGQATVWPGGIAVLEPHTPPDPLLQLHADLAEALLALGLTPEQRKYKPHVTMARRAHHANVPVAGPPIAWEIASYALVESRDGSYNVLRQYS
jgi:2'-5' RNA ligase